MPRRRSSSAPLTKTFHVYYSKLKRSITTVPRKHHNPPSIVINSSAYDITSTTSTTSPDFASDDAETNVDVIPPDFSSTVFASHRFFCTSPGRSNSIVESRCIIIRDQEISEDTLIITSPDFASDDAETNVNVIPPDFSSTVFASHRFFCTSPGRSNSIVEPRCIIRDQEISEDTLIINLGGGIPVQTYSSNPFIDFRRSMQQMVEANDILDVRADHYRKFMRELLLCYLSLNAKNTHIFIIQAFIDVLISLATSPPGYRCSTSRSTMASIEE